jgi:hypothetical protein
VWSDHRADAVGADDHVGQRTRTIGEMHLYTAAPFLDGHAPPAQVPSLAPSRMTSADGMTDTASTWFPSPSRRSSRGPLPVAGADDGDLQIGRRLCDRGCARRCEREVVRDRVAAVAGCLGVDDQLGLDRAGDVVVEVVAGVDEQLGYQRLVSVG